MADARTRGRRALFSLLTAAVLSVFVAQTTFASVSWTSAVKASATYTYNYGGSTLARSTSSTASYLHSTYVSLSATYPGVYYRRGSSSGATWGTAKRLNSSTGYADYPQLAGAGKYVAVVYQQIASWDDYDPGDPRSIRVRVNTNHGSATAWRSGVTVSTGSRAGIPAIAASGDWAYVAYTDAEGGEIRVVRMSLPGTSGTTTKVVGATSRTVGDGAAGGFDGHPVIAATGSTVMVAWISQETGTLLARISTDRGSTWGSAETIDTADVWDLSARGSGGRIGLAWARDSGVRAKIWRSGAWGTTRTVASVSPTSTYKVAYGTSIALAGTGRVGVAWSSCTASDCSAGSTKGSSVRWRESTDNLASWKSAVTIASYTYGTSRRISEFPSVVFTSTPKRYITYNASTSAYGSPATYLEVGGGAP